MGLARALWLRTFSGSFLRVVLFVLDRRALSPWSAEIAMKENRIRWPMARAISKLLDRRLASNEFIDGQREAKNRPDVNNDSNGRSIRILRLSTEKRRFRSPLYTMIPKANSKPAISRITSMREGMPMLKPTSDALKGQNSITLPINKSPKAKCCTTATK